MTPRRADWIAWAVASKSLGPRVSWAVADSAECNPRRSAIGAWYGSTPSVQRFANRGSASTDHRASGPTEPMDRRCLRRLVSRRQLLDRSRSGPRAKRSGRALGRARWATWIAAEQSDRVLRRQGASRVAADGRDVLRLRPLRYQPTAADGKQRSVAGPILLDELASHASAGSRWRIKSASARLSERDGGPQSRRR